MAIVNPARAVALTTEYLNLPVTPGISPNGYWFYYTPAVANNTSLGAKVTPYRYGQKLTLVDGQTSLTIEGTIPLITESWAGANTLYHGSSIEWIGPGVNDITDEQEGDAFFFGHMGAVAAADDVFYWDRVFVPIGGTEYNYYQYHQHSPTSYVTYENGRQTMGGDGWIDPGDKAYGYLISTNVRVSSVNYSSVLARIHTPSVGGAHNSHNDVTLPTVATQNYMPLGILRGIGERYHAFYMRADGSQWRLFTRTYTDAAGSFTAQTDLGVFDFADPLFNRAANQQSQYPVRASAGTSFGARIYFPVIMNNATSGFDLEIWSFNSLDTISGGSLQRTVCVSGTPVRPDAFCAVVGTQALYVLHTDGINGGVRLWKFDGTTFTDVGTAVSNSVSQPLRVHGFEFNSEDFKFYSLLSGTAAGGGDYLGPGLYTFELDDEYEGYMHLDYDAANNAFVERGPLTAGYLKYTQIDASFSRINSIEPQAIGAGINIMDYSPPGASFFNRKSVGFGGKDFYYHSITLADGRRFAVGQVAENPGNLGTGTSGDFLFSLYSSDLNQATHFAYGGAGDDYFTGVCQCKRGRRIWLTGYTKSEVVPKGDILIHGWVRNMSDGSNAMEWKDITVDTDGNVYLVGSHVEGWLVLAKYDKNYVLQWQRRVGDGESMTDIGRGITVDSTGNIYVVGSTAETGAGNTDALLIKMSPAGDAIYAKVYGTASADSASSVAVIDKAGTEYVVMPVVTGTSTTFLVVDLSGNIVEQNTVSDLVVNRVRYNQTDADAGRFLFSGNDGAVTKTGKFGMGEILSATQAIQWISSYSGMMSVDLNDIANSDTDKYVICGDAGHDGLLFKVTATESTPGTWTVTRDWARNMIVNPGDVHPCNCGFNSLSVTPYTETDKYIYVVGSSLGNVVPQMGMDEGIITRWQADGTLDWQNVFGHDMAETFVGVVNDTTGKNIIVAGWSESHSFSRDAVFFRCWNQGYGTGLYTPEGTSAMPYYYVIADYATEANTDTFAQLSAPANVTGSLVATAYAPTVEESFYSTADYNGAFGPNGVFNFILAYLDLDLLQAWLNSDTYKENVRNGVKLNYIDDWNLVGKIWQAGTVGDGSADDGNMFGYDVQEVSTDLVYAIGQTSGDVTKTNLGASGVYDYLLVKFDPVTEEMEFYQNGTARDEETYALTELADGRIAYVGRTTGDLADPNFGGYDIFLGIFDPDTETSDYYSIGSGLDDAAVNVHDLGNNELAVVYFSYGSLTGTINTGSQDIGVIKFNYSTDTWGTAYQTGSNTSELFEQNGKPSALLTNGRIAITASSTGIFADNAVTYGFLDVCLAILDLTTGEWSKFQVGTTANEISSSASAFGDVILIGGNQGGSFDDDIDAIFVEFDASDGFVGKSSSVT